MKKLLFPINLLLVLILFSGCFEVLEEITLNDDGSGHINFTVNLSQSKSKLNSIMLMDSINDYKVPSKDDILVHMNELAREIGQIKGVTNVQKKVNFTDFVFSMSCNFTSVEVLNRIISHFSSGGVETQSMEDYKQFSYDSKKKIFKRFYNYNLAQETKKVKSRDRQILDGATVTTIYRFESNIVKSENPASKIAKNNKAVMLKVGVQDMINKKNDITNTITLN
ncbi:MAG TPA: hypothetical protein PK147_07400 [Saprospiraceae bacterium]|mgnify:CR=1 FL=1|nr:hypothetical protein [Saprospiraceae bacterium]MCB9328585.1 hypothetical protein [Lewinellaceae bacterium]HPK10272.1 hypothetical protein [Saprospiraceae bacterium]HPQ21660.1 hypothetical protein [Saprospiraceae bacterium]HRX29517.1 hypothetical protein [Saprospiraceae bacterium]